MANRFPLVFDAQQSKSIKELPNGDNLNLAGSSIVDAVNINVSGEITANSLTVNTLNVAGVGGTIASVAISNDYNDLDNLPILFSGSYNDLTDVPIGVDWSNITSKPTIPSKLSELVNDAGFANEESLNIRADQLIGLAPVAVSNSFTDLDDANEIVTQSQLVGDTLTVEVTNTGDLVGSVFGADSTLLVDHLNNIIYADISTSKLVSNDENLIITTPNKLPLENITIEVAQAGNIFIEGDEITLTGKVNANRLYGAFTGFVYSNDSTLVVNPDTGDLNGKLNGEVDGDINKTGGGTLNIQSASGGIAITPNGDFNIPNATNIELRATNDAVLSATGVLTLQSSSGTIEFNGSQIDASLSDINFANADLNFTGSTLNFLNATVNNLNPSGNVAIGGDLSVTGDTNVSGNFAVAGNLSVAGNGAASFNNDYYEDGLSGGFTTNKSILQIMGADYVSGGDDGGGITISAGRARNDGNRGDVIISTGGGGAEGTGIISLLSDYITAAGTWIGTNTMDIKGSVFGDDSTLLVDGVSGKIVGTIDTKGNQARFSAVVSQTSDLDDISPATYHGMIMHVHNEGAWYGAHAGAWHKIADVDSSLKGDLQGSIFADDSTLLVDGVAGKIVGDYENGTSTIGSTRVESYDIKALQDTNTTDLYVANSIYGGETGTIKNVAIGSTAPSTSNGASGDISGMIAFDSNYIYYCTATYTDGVADIWKRVAWSVDTW